MVVEIDLVDELLVALGAFSPTNLARRRAAHRHRCSLIGRITTARAYSPTRSWKVAEASMQSGVFIFPTEYTIDVVDLARAAEDQGFESLWVPEHTHIPAERRSPWSGGAELPLEYSHALDPFLALTAAAAVTSQLRLGTGVCLVVERDPIITAKEIATLDHLSGGRFLFGVGGGWNLEEMA